MKVLFDTDLIVAGLMKLHEHHPRCRPWLGRAISKQVEAFISATTLAETYATITSLPEPFRISPSIAHQMLIGLTDRAVSVVSLTGTDYLNTLHDLSAKGITGRIVYDAMIARAAVKAKVNRLLTFNTRDFLRVWPLDPKMVREP